MYNGKNQAANSYYGACNGYYGFKSLFSEIFDPENFTRVYVIKGGPGTGKSSLMRKALGYFSALDLRCEEIYCSSDPASLDGIILENERGKVAILDGTAPHETDAKYPGAKDEILNLGDGFDKTRLMKYQDEIVTLSKNKKEYYNRGYLFLSLAGKIHAHVLNLAKERFDFKKARGFIGGLSDDSGNSKPEKYFLSSFGARGLNTLQPIRKARGVRLDGNGYTEELFTTSLYYDGDLKINCDTVFLSCLDSKYAEGAAFRNSVIMKNLKEYDEKINSCDYCDFDFEKVRELISAEKEMLRKAEASFKYASEEHFKLEEIYKTSVNFANNDKILEKAKTEIEDLLSLS